MNRAGMIRMMISLHKKVDAGALSDAGWREYQEERRVMEAELKKQEKRWWRR
jgi:hypothetical protein